MKCDDDTFVNVPNLIHYLLGGTVPIYDATLHYREDLVKESELSTESVKQLRQYENLLVGFRLQHPTPVSNTTNKGYEGMFWKYFATSWRSSMINYRFTPRYMYDKKRYPSFLAGGPGYVLTMDTAAKLYNAAMEIPYLHLEDVYLTGESFLLWILITQWALLTNSSVVSLNKHETLLMEHLLDRHLCGEGSNWTEEFPFIPFRSVQGFMRIPGSDFWASSRTKWTERGVSIRYECEHSLCGSEWKGNIGIHAKLMNGRIVVQLYENMWDARKITNTFINTKSNGIYRRLNKWKRSFSDVTILFYCYA